MSQIIVLKDGTELEFPENTDSAAIGKYVRNYEAGFIEKALTAGRRGVAALVGGIPDMARLAGEYGARMPWRTPEKIQAGQQMKGFLPSPTEVVAELPGTGFYREQMNKVLPPEVDAVTAPGRVAQQALEGAVAGAPFGVAGAAYGALSGGASEVAGQATAGSKAEPYVRAAAGILAPAVVAIPRAVRSTAGSVARQALDGVDPADLARARRVEEEARGLGVRLSPSQSLGPAGGAVRGMESDVGASTTGAQPSAAFFRAQDDALGNAAQQYVDTLGPPRSPVQVVNSVQNAARGVIQDARAARTAASEPWFRAAAGQTANRYDMQQMLGQIDAKIAEVGANSATGKALLKYRNQIAPEGDFVRDVATGRMMPNPTIGPLYNVYKETRDRLAAGPVDPKAPLNTTRGVLGPINQDVRDILTTNPDLSMGTFAYQMMSPRVNELRQPELLGRLQKAMPEDGSANLNTAMTRQLDVITNPNIARPATIDRVFSELGAARNPMAARDLARLYFQNTLAKVGVPDSNAKASRFVDELTGGNANTRANLEAVVRNVARANGVDMNDAVQGWRVFTQTFDAANTRPVIGSRTGPRAELTKNLESGGAAGTAVAAANLTKGSILAPIREALGRRRYAQLADALFGDEAGIDALVRLAKLPPDSEAARAAVSTMLAPWQQRE